MKKYCNVRYVGTILSEVSLSFCEKDHNLAYGYAKTIAYTQCSYNNIIQCIIIFKHTKNGHHIRLYHQITFSD